MEIQKIQLDHLPNGAHFNLMQEVSTRLAALMAADEAVRTRVQALFTAFGTALAGDAFAGDLPTEVRKDCIGVVFSVTDPTEDDPILKRDHPQCTHGLVVALEYAQPAKWSLTTEQVNNWTNAPRDPYQVDITRHRLRQGYANTRALREYNKAFPDKKVLPVESVDEYAKQKPSPPESSGWYWPSAQELHDIESNGIAGNGYFQEVGGVEYNASGFHWSSNEKGACRPPLQCRCRGSAEPAG